jgi:hypothetical protein
MKVILGDLRTRTGHDEIFHPTTGREVFLKASNSNQLRATDFAIINNATENIKLQEFCNWGDIYNVERDYAGEGGKLLLESGKK